MAWIESHQTLRTHRKTIALRAALKVPRCHVIGLLQCLWWWALDNAPDGDLSTLEAALVAERRGWPNEQPLTDVPMDRQVVLLTRRVAELEAQLRWTPVEEGLPSLGQHTLVRLADGEVTSGFWDGSGWECIGAYYAVRHITHWMTLPKAPEVKP